MNAQLGLFAAPPPAPARTRPAAPPVPPPIPPAAPPAAPAAPGASGAGHAPGQSWPVDAAAVDYSEPLLPWKQPACFRPSRAQLLHRVLEEVDRIGCMCKAARSLPSPDARRDLNGLALEALAALQPQVRELMNEREPGHVA